MREQELEQEQDQERVRGTERCAGPRGKEHE
jgi:hypothetical protein